MRSARLVEWHGERYSVEPLKSRSRVTSLSPIWAVSRRGEFIGTLAYKPDETPEALKARCIKWLRDLLATARTGQARLLSAAAHLYPGIPAGLWMQAATMADMVLAQRLRRGDFRLAERALDPAHFEFRSPEREAPPTEGGNPLRSNRPASPPE
jgi:hypothetical protein